MIDKFQLDLAKPIFRKLGIPWHEFFDCTSCINVESAELLVSEKDGGTVILHCPVLQVTIVENGIEQWDFIFSEKLGYKVPDIVLVAYKYRLKQQREYNLLDSLFNSLGKADFVPFNRRRKETLQSLAVARNFNFEEFVACQVFYATFKTDDERKLYLANSSCAICPVTKLVFSKYVMNTMEEWVYNNVRKAWIIQTANIWSHLLTINIQNFNGYFIWDRNMIKCDAFFRETSILDHDLEELESEYKAFEFENRIYSLNEIPMLWDEAQPDFYPEPWIKTYFRYSPDCGHWRSKQIPFSRACPRCLRLICPTGKPINPYSLRVPKYLSFQDSKENSKTPIKDKIYFGAEIELEQGNQDEAIYLHKEVKDYFLCKSDGSLNNGFEIVTAPATYEVHKSKAKELFTAINKTRLVPEKTCGLHFHVSRAALSTLQLGKILEFVFNPNNRNFITNVAGRDSNQFARLDLSKTITDVAPAVFSYESAARYEAINLKNKDTIEFRLFASTNKYDTFMSRLEFVKSLIDYTMSCAINTKSLKEIKNLEIFQQFLSERKKEYPFLASFLGMIKERPVIIKSKGKQ